MDSIKGTVEATIQLTKANCYYMTHGVCSLSVIEDHFISPTERVQPNDLFYCPRLYALMCGREKDKAIPAVPCNCGHVQILGNPQRACIAERKELVLPLEINDDKQERELCDVCGGQTTLHEDEEAGKRILSVKVHAVKASKK